MNKYIMVRCHVKICNSDLIFILEEYVEYLLCLK